MYGLEKGPKDKFDFDLEIDIKESPEKTDELLKRITNTISAIKDHLKKGGQKQELDDLGVLLQGYQSLLKVLKKVQKS